MLKINSIIYKLKFEMLILSPEALLSFVKLPSSELLIVIESENCFFLYNVVLVLVCLRASLPTLRLIFKAILTFISLMILVILMFIFNPLEDRREREHF